MDVHNFQTGWITIFLILLSCNIVEVAPFSDTILNAVNSIGKHFERVASTIESVVENVQVIERVLTDAIEEDCVYKCKNGELLTQNKLILLLS